MWGTLQTSGADLYRPLELGLMRQSSTSPRQRGAKREMLPCVLDRAHDNEAAGECLS